MPIVSTDIVFYKATTNTDASSNGGGPTATQVTQLFPNVTGDERTTGLTRYRKFFTVNKQTSGAGGESDLTLYNGKLYLRTISPGEDYYRLCKSPLTRAGFWDTQAQVSPETGDYAYWSGVGTLDADITASTQNFDVVAEAASGFNNARTVCITDGTHREFLTVSTVSWVSLTATLNTSGVAYDYDRSYFGQAGAGVKTATAGLCDSTHIGTTSAGFTPDAYNGKLVRIVSGTGAGQVRRVLDTTTEQLVVTYAWTTTPDGTSTYEVIKTYVSEVIEVGDVFATMTADSWDPHPTAGGTYDIEAHPMICYGGGTVTDDWTLSITSSTTMTVAGASSGTVLSNFNFTTGDVEPTRNGVKLFTIESYWGANWTTGDYIYVSTTAGMAAVWVKEVVAAASNPCGDNYWEIMATGDSA